MTICELCEKEINPGKLRYLILIGTEGKMLQRMDACEDCYDNYEFGIAVAGWEDAK